MAQQFLEKTTTTPTFPLNYDCAFELFKWLDFEECMNLSEAFEGLQCVADRIYTRKFNDFMFNLQQPTINDRVLYHAGPTMKSLTLNFYRSNVEESYLIKIRDTCKALECLTLKGFDRERVVHNPFCSNVDDLKVLTVYNCHLANDEDFFGTYKNLKCLNLSRCRDVPIVALKNCFEKNQRITSLTCDLPYLYCTKLLELLPNLVRLSIRYGGGVYTKSLNKLQSLRHLTLRCCDENVNDVLTDLATINILEELELVDVAVDGNTFELIKSFDNLQLLVVMVTSHIYEFPPSSDVLPTKLKTLRLAGFYIADNIISPLVEQHKYLQDIHLSDCELDSNGYSIIYIDSMTDLIIGELNSQTDRQLDIVLTSSSENYLSKRVVTAGSLSFYNYSKDPSKFEILYPGIFEFY